MIDLDAPMAKKMIEASSHETIVLYIKSKKRQAFLHALEKYGYELRVVLKGQCY